MDSEACAFLIVSQYWSYVFCVTTKSRVKRLYSTLHNHKLQEPSHIAVRNTDTSKNLYVYLADCDVQKFSQIEAAVIIAISENI